MMVVVVIVVVVMVVVGEDAASCTLKCDSHQGVHIVSSTTNPAYTGSLKRVLPLVHALGLQYLQMLQ